MVILDRNGKVVPSAPTADSIGRSARPRPATTTMMPERKSAPMLNTATFKRDLTQHIQSEVERVLEPLGTALQSLDAGLALIG